MPNQACQNQGAPRRAAAATGLREHTADNIVNGLRIGLAFGGFHDLADEEFEDPFVAGF
jgi:hypothetical protein